MEQLSGLDYLFIQQESPRTLVPTSPVIVEDVSELDRKLCFEEVLKVLERDLHQSTVLRRRQEDARHDREDASRSRNGNGRRDAESAIGRKATTD